MIQHDYTRIKYKFCVKKHCPDGQYVHFENCISKQGLILDSIHAFACKNRVVLICLCFNTVTISRKRLRVSCNMYWQVMFWSKLFHHLIPA